MHWESGNAGRREGTSGLASQTHIRTQKKDRGRGRGGVHGRLWFVRSFWEEVNMDQAVKQTGGHRVGKESMSGSRDVGSSSFLWKVEQSSSNLGVPHSLTRYLFFPPLNSKWWFRSSEKLVTSTDAEALRISHCLLSPYIVILDTVSKCCFGIQPTTMPCGKGESKVCGTVLKMDLEANPENGWKVTVT